MQALVVLTATLFAIDQVGAQPKLDPLLAVQRTDTAADTIARELSPCEEPGFAKFEDADDYPQELVVELQRKAHRAVESTGLPPCQCRVRYLDQSWWEKVEVFIIEHGSCWSLTIRAVAVDADDNTSLITGDLWQSDGQTTAEEALLSFNRLSLAEGVVIIDPSDATDYLVFFLDVFLQRDGAYLPDVQIASLVAEHAFSSEESELLLQAFKQIEQPVVEILSVLGSGFRARAFNWVWWCGSINRYDLTVTGDGTVTFEKVKYADQ